MATAVDQVATFGGGVCTLNVQIDNVLGVLSGYTWDNARGGDGLITIVNPPLPDQTIVVGAGTVGGFTLASAITLSLVPNLQTFFQWSTA